MADDIPGSGWVPEFAPDDEDLADEMAIPPSVPLTAQELFDYPVEVNRRVLHWIDEFKGRSRRSFEVSLRRSGKYLPWIREVFEEEGVPPDLAFLAHVESGFRYDARSPAGAVGMWQFMAGTARDLGLRCDKQVDERLDPEKSTRAAARYLRQLHDRYDDWHLALAAYNAGPGTVDRVIKSSGQTNFWEISKRGLLKNETRDFVPAILAATVLFKSPGAYGLAEDTDHPVPYDPVEVDGPTDLAVIASCADCETSDLVELNPALKGGRTPDVESYTVRVPEGHGDLTRARLEHVPPAERVVVRSHKVKRGETLSGIASRYGSSVRAIQLANDLGKNTRIRVGQTLKMPPSGSAPLDTAARLDVPKTASSPERREHPEGESSKSGLTLETTELPASASPQGTRANPESASVDSAAAGSAPLSSNVTAHATTTITTEPVHHKVRRGDTLFSLARRYGTTVTSLQKRNGIRNPKDLRVGQRLIVGEKEAIVAVPPPKEAAKHDDLAGNTSSPAPDPPSTASATTPPPASGSAPESAPPSTSSSTPASAVSSALAAALPSAAVAAPPPVTRQVSGAHPASVPSTHVLAETEDAAPPLPSPSPESLGRVASTAHVVEQARAEIAQQKDEDPAPVPEKTKSRAVSSHKVRSGDTLWSIAKKHGVGVTDLRRWNGLRGNTIRPGQKLRLAP